MEYDVNHYFEKFSGIPNENWCTNNFGYDGIHCAAGHCGYSMSKTTVEGWNLYTLFDDELGASVSYINDGFDYRYPQESPKLRILAALTDIRDKQLSEANLKATKELINQPSQLQEV